MNRISIFFLLMFLPLLAVGQSYEKSWTDIEVAYCKDLPVTALQKADSLYKRAVAEGNKVEMMRCLLMIRTCHNEYAPDSVINDLKRMGQVLQEERDSTMRALWHFALGKLYSDMGCDDTSYKRLGEAHLKASVSNLELLSNAKMKDYAPLFHAGKHNRYSTDDLLGVLADDASYAGTFEESRDLYRRIIRIYRKKGNRSATLLATLDSIDRFGSSYNSETWMHLDSLSREYADLPVNVETYIQLAEFQDRGLISLEEVIEKAKEGLKLYRKEERSKVLYNFIVANKIPEVRIEEVPKLFYPGKPYVAHVKFRNLKELEMVTYRLNLDEETLEKLSQTTGKDRKNTERKILLEKADKGIRRKENLKAVPSPYQWAEDSIILQIDRPGDYLIELRANGKHLDWLRTACSRLLAVNDEFPEKTLRIRLLDASAGNPLDGSVTVSDLKRKIQTKKYETAQCGTVTLKYPFDGPLEFSAQTGDDSYSPKWRNYRSWFDKPEQERDTCVSVFTDRSVYRPGQKVHFGGIVYGHDADNYWTVQGETIYVELYSHARHEVIDTIQATCDEMGSFSGVFQIPEVCLPGSLSLRTSRKEDGFRNYYGYCDLHESNAFIRIEEYKLPTFKVATFPVTSAYTNGDTVLVSGQAVSYTGIPVEMAQVKWSSRYLGETAGLPNATFTNADGKFTIPVVLPKEKWHLLSIPIHIDVTSGSGETIRATHWLRVGRESRRVSMEWKETLCKEFLPTCLISWNNFSNENLKAEGTCALWHFKSPTDSTEVVSFRFTTGQRFCPSYLLLCPSGKYKALVTLTDSVSGESDKAQKEFYLYSFSDKRLKDKRTFVCDLVKKENDSFVMIGSSCDSVSMVCDIITEDKLYESSLICFSDSILHFDIGYRPEYGRGATLQWTFVKDGRLYKYSTNVTKPVPDKRLHLTWHTFRSKLAPGDREEWKLRVTHSDGSPASANVMARLYDASLDYFGRNSWRLNIVPRPFSLHGETFTNGVQPDQMQGSIGLPMKEAGVSRETCWKKILFQPFIRRNGVSYAMATSRMYKGVETEAANDDSVAGEAGQVEIRRNFDETAFFYPSLRTDENGIATIAFTLPGSLTTWQFEALAHTRSLDCGLADTTVVARKQFMVRPLLPRFLHSGDSTSIPVNVVNLSENPLTATLRLEWCDVNGNRLHVEKRKVTLLAGETRDEFFTYHVPDRDQLMIVRATGNTQEFSDGEEHYLPVLGNRVHTTRTLPFSLTTIQPLTLRIDTLWDAKGAQNRQLTVEHADNPLWYALTALPSLIDDSFPMATELAGRYYALELGLYWAQRNPQLKEKAAEMGCAYDSVSTFYNETVRREMPWLQQSANEKSQARSLQLLFDSESNRVMSQAAYDELRSLQLPDGSWSWIKGMPGSAFVTIETAKTLARARMSSKAETISPSLERAWNYLEGLMDKHRSEGEYLWQHELDILYIGTLLDKKADKGLLKKLSDDERALSLKNKARAAVVLLSNGETEAGEHQLRSLLEHTVSTPEKGRYFDSNWARSHWYYYTIPVQTATMEALQTAVRVLGDESGEWTKSYQEMALWLLMAKRAQSWESSDVTIDALHALLSPSVLTGGIIKGLDSPSRTYYTLEQGKQLIDANADSQKAAKTTVGYFKKTYALDEPGQPVKTDSKKPARITFRQTEPGLSWGSVSVSMSIPFESAKSGGNGVLIDRRYEVQRNGNWLLVGPADSVRVGERIRQVFTLTADADYDFVAVKALRPACAEPVSPLSGYCWHGIGYYRAVHDATSEFFIERLSKGKHVFTEEYFVDRSGAFQCGISTVRCIYAPEFCGETGDFRINVAP